MSAEAAPVPGPGILRWALTRGAACFGASLAIGTLLGLLMPVDNPPVEDLSRRNPALLVAFLLGLPLLETLIGQWAPLALAGLFTRSAAAKTIFSSVCFAALHLTNSPANALVILLVPGPVFAWTFLRFRARSRAAAYGATTLTHVVHNACAAVLILAAA
jgi:membrane protease YdiL (CAAX protease family)